jgi:predicted GNAT family acetyltransferase
MTQPHTHRLTLEHPGGHTSSLSSTIHTGPDGQSWLTIQHVEVPPMLRGQGIAGTLVEQAFAYAQTHHLNIALVCPYAVQYAARHPHLQARVGTSPLA